MDDPDKEDLVTPCMDVYNAKIQSDESLDKLRLKFVVRVDLQNKYMLGDTWSPTASMITLKYLLATYSKRKEWNKNKLEKSALEDTISELNIKKSKIEASISAILTDGS